MYIKITEDICLNKDWDNIINQLEDKEIDILVQAIRYNSHTDKAICMYDIKDILYNVNCTSAPLRCEKCLFSVRANKDNTHQQIIEGLTRSQQLPIEYCF